MKRRIVKVGDPDPLLEIVSYGRGAPKSRRSLPTRDNQKGGRAPEVVIKVSGGARTLAGVKKSLSYFGRQGTLGMENDTGDLLMGKEFPRHLIDDWNLDLETHARQEFRATRAGRMPPRLVHNLIFSMPPGTPADKVLKAVRRFAAKEFGASHRHAMVLHTDEPHPHVHVVVKAVSEQGKRLYIRKPMLRAWRQKFALELRDLGVAANATERASRGLRRNTVKDRSYRAARNENHAQLGGRARLDRSFSTDPSGLQLREDHSEFQMRLNVQSGFDTETSSQRPKESRERDPPQRIR